MERRTGGDWPHGRQCAERRQLIDATATVSSMRCLTVNVTCLVCARMKQRWAQAPERTAMGKNNVWNGLVGATTMIAAGIVGAGCGDNQSVAPSVDARTSAATQAVVQAANGRNRLRPLAPLSGSMSGSRQPTFRYTPARGNATVEVCDDRACAHVIDELPGSQGAAQPETPLRAGVLFWRVVTSQTTSAVWQLTIPG